VAMGEELSFEVARDELAQIVNTLEQGGLSLEESLALWERGEALVAICNTWLDAARVRLEEQEPSRQNDDGDAADT
jgi:exodeoxyribonuclease VII small subunit